MNSRENLIVYAVIILAVTFIATLFLGIAASSSLLLP